MRKGKKPKKNVVHNSDCDETLYHTVVAEEGDSSCKMDKFEVEQGANNFCRLLCRNVRIGSYRTVPTGGVLFTDLGVRIPVASLEPESSVTVNVNIDLDDIVTMLYHFGKQMPVLFLYLSASAAIRIRGQLGMKDPKQNYFDPTSTDETLKRIVIMPEKLSEETKTFIKTACGGSGSGSNKRLSSSTSMAAASNFGSLLTMEELSQDEANTILVSASAPEVQAVVRQTAKSVNQLLQPSKTLLIFPPPPQKGGISITLDDYQVLEEESFLNDVILDFYLKWLLLSKLSEEMRNKVHLFSTFFYKRLTCKPKKMRRHHPIEDDPKLSAAEKRHARVKSWTKCVDIFEKDYIIIPINEHAHWFLAIICFPGLSGPVHFDTGESLPPEVAGAENHVNKRRTGRIKTRPEQIPIIDDGEWSDRDEAEGDEDELEDEDEDDEDGSGVSQPNRKKQRSSVGEPSIPGLGDDGAAAASAATVGADVPIKQPCILIFDSLSGGHRARIVATLRDYLSVEHVHKKGEARPFTRDTMKGACPRVPQQTNYSDCGLYTLQFTESFFDLPLKDYRFPMRSISEWFDQSVVAGKREAIALLIKELMNKYNPNNNIKLPAIYFNTAEEREKGGRASCQVEERERAERLALERTREKALNATKVKAAHGDALAAAATATATNCPTQQDTTPLLGKDGHNNEAAGIEMSTCAIQTKDLKQNASTDGSSKNEVAGKKLKQDVNDRKFDELLKCSNIDETNGNVGTDDSSESKSGQSSSIVSKITKPHIIRPGPEASNSYTKVQSNSVVGGDSKTKKLVLGSIPIVKPFGTVQDKSSVSKKSFLTPSNLLTTATVANLGPGLAAIHDTYSQFDASPEEDVENNNNESMDSMKHSATLATVGIPVSIECSSGNTATVATVQLPRDRARAGPQLNGLVLERVVGSGQVVSVDVTSASGVMTTLATTESGVSSQDLLSVESKAHTSALRKHTTNRTDHAHMNSYPILASSLGNGPNNRIESPKLPICSTPIALESSSNSKISKSTNQNDDSVSSTNLIVDTIFEINNSMSSEGSTTEDKVAKNGHLHEFIVGEISGKKAVYSEDNSEVYMYLSSEEGNSLSQEGSERGDLNSPDLYGDLEGTMIKDQSIGRSDLYAEDTEHINKSLEGTPNSPCNASQTLRNASATESSGSSNNSVVLPTQCYSSEDINSSSGSSSVTGSGSVVSGSSGATTPACFRFSERGTSSGRVIAPPKRYLDHTDGEVKRKCRKTKGTGMGHR